MQAWPRREKLFRNSTLRLRKRQHSELEGSSVPIRCRPQPPPALPFQRIDLGEDDRDVLLLLIEHGAALRKHLQEFDQLRPLPLGRLVKVEQLADLAQRKAEALAAQNQLDAHSLALGVDAPLSRAPRGKQAFTLVEADRARREREFLGELGNAVGTGFRRGRRWHGSGA